jgi:CheY-like chemotaxis protein/HPt (histidine-containing phosphotransfer) domain-containing protein
VNALGYAAEVAANGLEALDLWRSGRFAMVITDCDMPEMNGYELTRNIRSIEAANAMRRTPVIAYTAYAMLGEADNCLAAGMDDYLSKPVDLKRLYVKLQKWLPIPARAAPSAHAASGASGGPIDTAVLGEISGGDRATERELLLRFGVSNDDDAARLRRAVGQSNLPEVRHIAHRMQGAGRTVGAAGLAAACERIEGAAGADDAHAVAAGVASLDRELDRLTRYLKTIQETHQDARRS